MKVWLHQSIADAIRCVTSHASSEKGPQLCCEVGGIVPDRAVKLLVWHIRSWEREVLAGFIHVGSSSRVFLFDSTELEGILQKAVKSEEVVGVADLTTPGGCAVDFTPDGVGTVEMLVTAWGSHESISTALAEQLSGAILFRGN